MVSEPEFDRLFRPEVAIVCGLCQNLLHALAGVLGDDSCDDLSGFHQVIADRLQFQGAAAGLNDQWIVDHEAAVGQHVALRP